MAQTCQAGRTPCAKVHQCEQLAPPRPVVSDRSNDASRSLEATSDRTAYFFHQIFFSGASSKVTVPRVTCPAAAGNAAGSVRVVGGASIALGLTGSAGRSIGVVVTVARVVGTSRATGS